MAVCFAPRARSVFRRSLGATQSVGCGPVFGGDRVTHRARAAPRLPSRPSLRSRQSWGNEIEKPNKFPDRWWNVVSVAVTIDVEQSKHIGRTGPLLTRTGLVAAFLATAGVVAVERSAHADGIVRCWGSNAQGQCNPPADLGPCSSVAGGLYHTIAIEEACPRCPSSLTGNCIVNGADLGILLNAWGTCPN